jgi:recombination protein RecT
MSTKPAKREQADAPAQNQNNEVSAEAILRRDIHQQGKLFGTLLATDERGVAKFMASAFHAIRSNPKLLEAHRGSLLLALGEAAVFGLDVNPAMGECWLIPRWDKNAGAKIVNFQLGYKGLMKLARRAGDVRFHVDVVRKGDLFKQRGGTDPGIDHEPCFGHEPPNYDSDDSIVAAYAVAWEEGSKEPQFVVVRRAKLLQSRSRSGDPRNPDQWSDVWDDHFEAMCRKVAIARLSKLLTRADDLKHAVNREEMRDAGKDPGPIVEQLRDLLKQNAQGPTLAAVSDSGLGDLTSLPMPETSEGQQVIDVGSA